MSFADLLIIIAVLGIIPLTSLAMSIFKPSRTFGEWILFLLKPVGHFLMQTAYFLLQMAILLGGIMFVWGIAYYSLVWAENHLSSFGYYVVIFLAFVYFFLWLWFSGRKEFLELFGGNQLVHSSRKRNPQNFIQQVGNFLSTIMQRKLSVLLPLMIILGLIMLGVTTFAAFTSALVSQGTLSFEASTQPDMNNIQDYFLWQVCEYIPSIKFTKTLKWDEPLTYKGAGIGWIVLVFKGLIAYMVIARFNTWNKWRKGLLKNTTASPQDLAKNWFDAWEAGDFQNLPVSDNFTHTSPYGTVQGKEAYVKLVEDNKEKFLGHKFEIKDSLYGSSQTCIRYVTIQEDFQLEVTEWHYIKEGKIEEIVAYYNIPGEIREDRKLKE